MRSFFGVQKGVQKGTEFTPKLWIDNFYKTLY